MFGKALNKMRGHCVRTRIAYNWDDHAWDVDHGEPLEYIEMEKEGFTISLEQVENFYLIKTYTEQATIFWVTDNKNEASISFKEELAYLVYESPGIIDKNELLIVEQALERHGFLEDMKSVYNLVYENGGKIKMDIVYSDALNLLIKDKYPNLTPHLTRLVFSALSSKGYINSDWNNKVFVVAKELDF